MFYKHLKLLQVQFEFLGSGIDRSDLVDSLNSLGGDTKLDLSAELLGVEPLLLKVDMLYLLDALVRESDNTGLAVGRLAEQITDTCPHLHRSSAIAL